MKDVLVVKLGGSLAGSAGLRGWLEVLETCGQKIIIVPGGGPFADAVRAAQPLMGYDDATAHDMALLAMAQYGQALAGLSRTGVLVSELTEIEGVLLRRRIPVWSPQVLVGDYVSVQPGWDVTSDSLAAWLAGRLGARRLLLVKQVDPGDVHADDLATRHIVDPRFAAMLTQSGAQGWIAGPVDLPGAGSILKAGGIPGQRIHLPPPQNIA